MGHKLKTTGQKLTISFSFDRASVGEELLLILDLFHFISLFFLLAVFIGLQTFPHLNKTYLLMTKKLREQAQSDLSAATI